MNLIDLKLTKKQAKKKHSIGMEPAGPEYSYGLEMSLGNEELDKLGLNVKALEVGGEVAVQAEARITRISMNEDYSDNRKSVSLRLEKMAVAPVKKGNKDDLDWDTPTGDAEKVLQKRGVLK